MPQGFDTVMHLGHEHYVCQKCGESFCARDVLWAYHDCKCRKVFYGVLEGDQFSGDLNVGEDNLWVMLNQLMGKKVKISIEEAEDDR